MSPAHDVQAAGNRVETLLAEFGGLADAAARLKAEELVRALVELYGAGLERVVEIVTEAGAAEVLRRLASDEVVSGLLVLHDLHPLSTAERVREAVEGVRPRLGGHAGDVELVEAGERGVVRLRLRGAGHACPSSRARVVRAVEHAVARAAPEVSGVEVEGAAAPPAPLLQIGHRPPDPCPAPAPGAVP